MDLFAAIEEFHVRFNLQRSERPAMLTPDMAAFRCRFMTEELTEYYDACAIGDRAQALDALVDLVYVALGTAYLHGFDFNEAFKRVHAANLKKIRVDHAGESKRGSVYDVRKPVGWRAPDLSDLVE